MLSAWHVHARGYAHELNEMPDVKIAAVYDEEPERGRPWAAELGVDFEPDLATFLARDDIDAVVVDSPTHLHHEVMVAAAEAGKHIFTEKVMALTVAECKAVAEAVRKAGVQFSISFPQRTTPQPRFAKRVADEKLIGDVTLLRVRVAHDGASAGWLPPHFYDPVACGGGAMIDLGAHPMYLARWILGKPTRVTALFNAFTGCDVEDNAVALIEFDNKAIAIVETSFVSSHSPFWLELYGTEGSLIVGGPDNRVQLISNLLGTQVQGWISPSQLPEAEPRPIRQWVEALLEGRDAPFGIEDGTQLTALMEAAYASYRQNGAAVPIQG